MGKLNTCSLTDPSNLLLLRPAKVNWHKSASSLMSWSFEEQFGDQTCVMTVVTHVARRIYQTCK